MGFGPTDLSLFLGRRGSGKSYLARRVSQSYPRKVIFDTLSEYSANDGVLCHDFNVFCDEILKTEHADQFTIIYQFDVESSNQTDEFNEAMRVLWYRGNIFVLIEEVQNFATPHTMPHWLKQSIFTGRHRNMGLGFTTQRPGECHKSIISQSNHVFFGSLHEKNDLDYCKSVLGARVEMLPKIPPHEFVYFQPGGKALQHLSPEGKLSEIFTNDT